MAHLIFRCNAANRVITTGIEIDPCVFGKLHKIRTIPCRFCGDEHTWELIEHLPATAALMSLKAEGFLGRAIEDESNAAKVLDPETRDLYERIAGQWYELAADHEAKAEILK